MNKIIKMNGGYAVCINSEKYGDLMVLVDECDIDVIKNYHWTVINSSKSSVRLYAFSGKLQKIMHRVILNPPDDMQVDHINGNSLDNRRCNLRVCTFADNMKNRSISKRSRSGVTGVGWHKKGNNGSYGWKAYIQVDKKLINLGFFETFEEAVKIRKEAEEKYFGEFLRDEIHREITNGILV